MQLRLRQLLNFIWLVYGYLISRITKRVYHRGMPVAVSIEPNNTCNLHCPECPAGIKELTRPQGFMDPILFRSIIDQLSPFLAYLTLYFQGEPYLSKHLFDFVAYARSQKIFTVTSTNGHFLNEKTVKQTIDSGLNRLIISLDGFDRQSYEQYRKGGDFVKVIEGIRLVVSEKKRQKRQNPQIILQCLILKPNENNLEEIRRLGKELGVDQVVFKTAQFNNYKNGNPLMPVNPKFSRYTKKVQSSKFKVQSSSQSTIKTPLLPISNLPTYQLTSLPSYSCFRSWSSCVITWDGKVVPCCFDKDAAHLLGDLTKQSFQEIREGKPIHDFRRKILLNRKGIDICSNCSQTF
ncbi:MAG: radical SAM protein [Bacteroidetes bacterium]|nr:radical SAM protein [Bacteroidota bacterium]